MAAAVALRHPRYSPAIACETWMEVSEWVRRAKATTDSEIALAAGDSGRLARLESVADDLDRALDEGRRMAAWADAADRLAHATDRAA